MADLILRVITSTLPGPDVEELLGAEAKRPGWRIGRRPYRSCTMVYLVDGAPVGSRRVESGDGWAVQAEFADHVLSVVGVRQWGEDLAVVRIIDPEPYSPVVGTC